MRAFGATCIYLKVTKYSIENRNVSRERKQRTPEITGTMTIGFDLLRFGTLDNC